ncbi:MAG: sigma-70 family RNA polymerase sigma factor, partial [Candidatus Moranbacteria bacterium]|nr:sigma-70 family RNA polymerase sigma factor [Candidatus Moranbacteria bacterium]
MNKNFENLKLKFKEEDLINRLNCDDEKTKKEAQDEFYKQYYPFVLHTISKCFNFPPENSQQYMEIQELTQEVFRKAFRAIDRFKQNSKISTWLYTIASNTYKNYLKSNKGYLKAIRNDENNKPEELSYPDNPEQILLIKEILRKIKSSLSERALKVAKLCYLEGKTMKEIAKILDISKATVHNDLTKFKNTLKEETGNS